MMWSGIVFLTIAFCFVAPYLIVKEESESTALLILATIFIVLGVVNTVGIAEIIYITYLYFKEKKNS